MLSYDNRTKYFRELGLGPYNPDSIKKLQKKYFVRAVDIDGEYGPNTDKLLVNLYRVTKYAPHFKLTEFKCHCGGRFCTGYHEYISVDLLKNLEALRTKFGGPINITSGLRCTKWNKLQAGSATHSKHIDGKAADISGPLTSTSTKRAAVKAHWYKLKNSNYSYFGTANMGTSVHVDVR